MDIKNVQTETADLNHSVLLLQLVAWRKLMRERKVGARAKLSPIPNESIWIETMVEKSRLLAKKYPFMEITDEVLSSYSFEKFNRLLDESAAFETKDPLELIRAVLTDHYEQFGGASNESRQLLLSLFKIEPSHRVFISYFDHPELITLDAMIRSNYVTVIDANLKLVGVMNCLLEKKVSAFSEINAKEWETVRSETYQMAIADLTKNSEYYDSVWSIFELIKANRKILIVPNEFLTRSRSDDPVLRMDILLSGELEAVVTLPAAILGRDRPESSLLIFDRSTKRDYVYLVDLANMHRTRAKMSTDLTVEETRTELKELLESRRSCEDTTRISINECRDHDYSISPSFYRKLRSESSAFTFLRSCETKSLKDVVQIIRIQSLNEHRLVGQGEKYYVVTASDISEFGFVREPKNEIELPGYAFFKQKLISKSEYSQRWESQGSKGILLEPEDILLGVKGAVGRVGYVSKDVPNNWITNQSLIILRLKANTRLISPVVLYRFLSSSIGQAQIKAYGSSGRVQFIRVDDLKRLKIPIPTIENQKEIVAKFHQKTKIYQKIEELRQQAFRVNGNDYKLFK